MPQIQAPKDIPTKALTDADRKKLDVWPTVNGWCSACGRGMTWGNKRPVPVVNVGSRKKDIYVALCHPCLGRMSKTAAENGGDPR